MRVMRGLLKFLFYLILLAVIVGTAGWFWAGRMDGPSIEIRQPGKYIGQTSSLEMMVQAPGGTFTRLDVAVEQDGKTHQIFALTSADAATNTRRDAADRLM